MFSGKTILITGGTGSLGTALTTKLLNHDVKSIRIFSRDEAKHVFMQEKFPDKRLRFLIGDVRDKERLKRAMEDVNIVIHTAAIKQIHIAEYNPFECIKTNIQGSQNVIDTAMDEKVELCLGVSTDKAVSPLNLYGATKLAMEKLFVDANLYKGSRKTKFFCVRYGNVFGSRGSVIPRFIEQIRTKKEISVTDPTMTRFNITMDEALELIFKAMKMTKGSEIFIPKIKSYQLSDLIQALKEISTISFKSKKIPVRRGEKIHELLLNKFEIPYAIESKGLFILLPPDQQKFNLMKKNYPDPKKIDLEIYSSETAARIPNKTLKKILIDHKYIP